MARIEGKRVGDEYRIVSGDAIVQTYTLHAALDDAKLQQAIARNKWEPVLSPGEVIA